MFSSKTNLFVFLLLAVVFSAYVGTLGHEFVWDDEDLIERNPRIRNLEDLSVFFGVEPFYPNYFRPLLSLSLALDYSIWELEPLGYHLSNLIFHLGCVLMVYLICISLMPKLSSFLVALLFGIHPIHTEAVTWVSGRSDVLSTLFFLSSLLCLIRFATSKPGKRPVVLYIFSCILFFFALLTKEMAVTLPLTFSL